MHLIAQAITVQAVSNFRKCEKASLEYLNEFQYLQLPLTVNHVLELPI